MPIDIWYDLGTEAVMKAVAEKNADFAQWRLYTPMPRTPGEAGKAVEKILDKYQRVLININQTSKATADEKPRHD